MRVQNIGKPIRLPRVQIHGISAEAARADQKVKVLVRITCTSDEPFFHLAVSNLASLIEGHAQAAGEPIRLNRAETVLLVIKPDDRAELYVDTAAVALRCMVRRDVTAGSVVFENDIADVTGMMFPAVAIEEGDRVMCIFRQDWRFGYCADFNPEKKLDLERFTTSLGTLYRRLKYRHLYDTVENGQAFGQLLQAGWFPFVDIIGSEFALVASACTAGFPLDEAESTIVSRFDDARLDRLLERWGGKPALAARRAILKSAIDAFKRDDPIAVIKILITEVEGVLRDAYRDVHGQGAKLHKLLPFAANAGERKAGSHDTLLLPRAFADYLENYAFAQFDPATDVPSAGSRHAVGHGAAPAASYTMARALQAILTVDQLVFYT